MFRGDLGGFVPKTLDRNLGVWGLRASDRAALIQNGAKGFGSRALDPRPSTGLGFRV